MHIVRFSAPLLWALAGCAQPGSDQPPVVRDLGPGSPEASCVSITPPTPGTPSEVVSLTDGRVLVNDGLARRTFLLDSDLALLASLSYQAEGPLGVMDPQDLNLFDDSLVVYADRPSQRLKFISLSGEDRGGVDLSFPPERLVPWGDGFIIAETVLSPAQDQLLHAWHPGSDAIPLDMRPQAVADWQMRSLANLVLLLPQPEGKVAGVHQFIVSAGFLVHGPDSITHHPVPVAEAMAPRVDWLPNRPFTEEEMMQIATPVLDASPDPETGGILVLTRTGMTRGHHSEKAVLRLDATLRYVAGLRLPVNAGHLAYLPDRQEVAVVTDEDRWLLCSAP